MIAYEELVAALTNWRARQGLPTGHTDFLGQPPTHLSTTILAPAAADVEEIEADSLVEEIDAIEDIEAVEEIGAYDVVGEQTDVAVALGDDDSVQYADPAGYDEAPIEEAPEAYAEAPVEDLGYGEAAGELGYGAASGELGATAPAADDYENDAPTAIAGEVRADTDDSPFEDAPFEAASPFDDGDHPDDEATMIASSPEPEAPALAADDSTMDVDIEAEALLVGEEDAPALPGADIQTAPMAAMEMADEVGTPPPLAPPPLADAPADEPTMDVDLSDVVDEESDQSS